MLALCLPLRLGRYTKSYLPAKPTEWMASTTSAWPKRHGILQIIIVVAGSEEARLSSLSDTSAHAVESDAVSLMYSCEGIEHEMADAAQPCFWCKCTGDAWSELANAVSQEMSESPAVDGMRVIGGDETLLPGETGNVSRHSRQQPSSCAMHQLQTVLEQLWQSFALMDVVPQLPHISAFWIGHSDWKCCSFSGDWKLELKMGWGTQEDMW